MWDDFHIRNADYTDIFFGLTLKRVNALELRLLQVMHNDLWVSPSQYALVHFHIQEMFAKNEIHRAEAELTVERRRSSARRKKPSPVSVTKRRTPPSTMLSTQIHCMASSESQRTSGGKGGEEVCTSHDPQSDRPVLAVMRTSIRRFLSWSTSFTCGRLSDVCKSGDMQQ